MYIETMPRHGQSTHLGEEIPWNNIPCNRPADLLFGKTGAFKWRQLYDKDNCGDIEVMCRNGMTKEEVLVVLSYQQEDGFKRWLSDQLIHIALPDMSPEKRDVLLGIF